MSAKKSKSFRLSGQAVEALERLVMFTGSNETAILEMAIIRFDQFMISGPVQPEDPMQSAPVNQPKPVGKHQKARRRH